MDNTPTVLKKIVDRKFEEIKERRAEHSEQRLLEVAQSADKPRGFVAAMEAKLSQAIPAVS